MKLRTQHSSAISIWEMVDLEMYAWGKSASGQLAVGEVDEDQISLPVQVPYYEGFTPKVVDVACGLHHTVFLTKDGMVYTCGSNDSGQLGHGKVSKSQVT